MDSRRPPEYTLEVTADRANTREVVKGVLHTLFFHRLFTPLYPATHDVLDLTLPYISDTELEALLDTRTTSLLRALDSNAHHQQQQQHQQHHTSPQYHPKTQPHASSSSPTAAAKGTLQIHFLERKRRKSGWFVTKQDEETIWEIWTLDITQTVSGHSSVERSSGGSGPGTTTAGGAGGGAGGAGGAGTLRSEIEVSRQRRQMERDLRRAALKIMTVCARDRAHIPPITTNEANPFPYQILVNPPKSEGWGQRIGGMF